MPGLSIHLATANEYIKNHPNENVSDFICGSIAPDFAPDVLMSHHSKPDIFDSALSYLSGKVVLEDCLQDFNINTSFGRGYFLHLILDDQFYSSLAKDKKTFKMMTHKELKEKLYHDYTVTNTFFKNKYKIAFPENAEKYDIELHGDPYIINIEDTCEMIKELGSIDLKRFFDAKLSNR